MFGRGSREGEEGGPSSSAGSSPTTLAAVHAAKSEASRGVLSPTMPPWVLEILTAYGAQRCVSRVGGRRDGAGAAAIASPRGGRDSLADAPAEVVARWVVCDGTTYRDDTIPAALWPLLMGPRVAVHSPHALLLSRQRAKVADCVVLADEVSRAATAWVKVEGAKQKARQSPAPADGSG